MYKMITQVSAKTLDTPNPLLSYKRVVIIHPFSESEVTNPRFGGSRLILEQIKTLKDSGHNVNLISLENVGSLVSLFYRIKGSVRRERTTRYNAVVFSENKRWWLNVLVVVLQEILTKLDFLFAIRLRNKLKIVGNDCLVIYHYPYSFSALTGATRSLGNIRLLIYEHNIEWKFYENSLGKNAAARFLVSLCKRIELRNLRKADHLFCLSKTDRDILVSHQIDPKIITVWMPAQNKVKIVNVDHVPVDLRSKLISTFAIGFVGTNFGPNIVAVENIIDIAERLSDTKITFLVIGNVSTSFIHADIPDNIIFTGPVEELDSYLSLCKAFVNLKTTSDTGIEIKMFDYLKFDKPIIATRVGSYGFEDFENVIITDLEDAPILIRRMAEVNHAD